VHARSQPLSLLGRQFLRLLRMIAAEDAAR
jgi:hypothetical protein